MTVTVTQPWSQSALHDTPRASARLRACTKFIPRNSRPEFFFGRDVYRELNGEVPIGLVASDWGGQAIQVFSSPDKAAHNFLVEHTSLRSLARAP